MSYQRYRTDNRELEVVQDRLEEAFRISDTNFTTGSIVFRDISMIPGSIRRITHNLGYAYTGYIVISMTEPAIITVVNSLDSRKSSEILLNTTASTTVSLLIF